MTSGSNFEIIGSEAVARRARAAVAAVQAPPPPAPSVADPLPAREYEDGVAEGRRIAASEAEGTVTAIQVLSKILFARTLLFLGLSGAVALAVLSWWSANPFGLGTMVAYDVLVLGPLVWLETKTRGY